MYAITHLSDLHLGWHADETLSHDSGALSLIKDQLSIQKPEIIVITGDITNNGFVSEYKLFQQEFSPFLSRCLVVPGNRDYFVYPENSVTPSIFQESPFFCSEYIKTLQVVATLREMGGAYQLGPDCSSVTPQIQLEGDGMEVFRHFFSTTSPASYSDVSVYGLDSNRPSDNSAYFTRSAYRRGGDGYIGQAGIEELEEKLAGEPSSTYCRIAALHHHVFAVPLPMMGGRLERHILLDQGALLKMLYSKRFGIVLHGHRHTPWIWKVESYDLFNHPMLFVGAGAATHKLTNTDEENSYNTLTIDGEELTIERIFVQSKRSQIVYQGKL